MGGALGGSTHYSKGGGGSREEETNGLGRVLSGGGVNDVLVMVVMCDGCVMM